MSRKTALAAVLMLAFAAVLNAEDPKPVVVVNPPSAPVPVQPVGTTSVTGNVNVTNVPTVTVANTPSVNVANTPAVNVASLPAVNLNNSAANPLPTKDVSQPGSRFFSTRLIFQKTDWAGTLACKNLPPVPDKQVLVLEFITGNLETSNVSQKISYLIFPNAANTNLLFSVVGPPFDDGFSDLNLSQMVKIYSDDHVSGAKVCFSSTDPGSILNGGGISLSGYFVDAN